MNTTSETSQYPEDELLPEYELDYSKAKPNRFAIANQQAALKVVVLDEDVAQIFSTPEAVNHALRSLIAAMPERK